MKRVLTLAAMMLCAPLASAAAASTIDGRYVDSGGYVEITIAPCAEPSAQARCGQITHIIRRKPGEPDNDVHNNDPAKRSRPILGISLLQELRWDDGAWRGEVYNPEDGGTYRAIVSPARGGALEVKGCLAFICRTRIWPMAD